MTHKSCKEYAHESGCDQTLGGSSFIQRKAHRILVSFSEVLPPPLLGCLWPPLPNTPDIWTTWDSSFGATGKQRRHRTMSYNGASFSLIISPVSSSPPQCNHCLSAKTGVCLRKWSLDVCLIWTSSVTEHAAQRAWVTLTKQLPPPYHGLQKDWKESSIRDLSLERCSVPMPGLPISPNSLFH